jgi:hypothetical protein
MHRLKSSAFSRLKCCVQKLQAAFVSSHRETKATALLDSTQEKRLLGLLVNRQFSTIYIHAAMRGPTGRPNS